MHIYEHKDPSNYLFAENKFNIIINKEHFTPGETIQGKIVIDLAKTVKAKSLKISLKYLKEFIPKKIGEYRSYQVYNQDLIIKGEKEYLKESYDFSITIPEDVLIKANNWWNNY